MDWEDGTWLHCTTIVSVYRPIDKQAAAEYQHQKTCIDRPSKVGLGQEALWFEDLQKLIGRLKRNRHEVIICGDFNCDLNDKDGKVNEFMQENGLRELLLERYGRGPATHINGSTTIDGEYAKDGIKIRQGGYIDEESVPSDHKCLDRHFRERFRLMLKKGQQDRPKMRKLKRLMKKYEYKGKKNHKSFQEIKPSAKELYKKHLYELALEKAEEDPKGKDPEWHMQQIERQMEIKEHFANIRKFEGKAGREGVERVNIEIEEDVLMSVYGREEIAEHIETANVEKRQQSKEPL
ncbi:predicted protein [Chaetoceros tenuissimus]|uniref:Endonuclease/exonuclease/phosphatase domain-containing protein n=1 Tax=Chaetoceros tenuissimus TaxID=426638 RepID=A0AAD3CR46_9STRA|nr:predicted protein [Chaetoceros tenuissimus]